MPIVHRRDFSYGVSDRPPSTLDARELCDSRNLWWRGVLEPCPGWEPIPGPIPDGATGPPAAEMPNGIAALDGCGCPDGSSLVVGHRADAVTEAPLPPDAAAGYHVYELSETEDAERETWTVTHVGRLPWGDAAGDELEVSFAAHRDGVVIADATDPEEAPATWTPAARNWPAVVTGAPGALSVVTIESLAVQERAWQEFRVGVSDQAGRFVTSEDEAQPDDWNGTAGRRKALTLTDDVHWLSISSDLVFNRVRLQVDPTTAQAVREAQLRFVSAAGNDAGSVRADPDAKTDVVDADGWIELHVDWSPALAARAAPARPVRAPFNGVEQATIGRDDIRAVVDVRLASGVPATLWTLELAHDQYLRVVMGEPPHLAALHNDRLWLATARYAQPSFVNNMTRWDPDDSEYFQGGGDRIEAMVSHRDYLLVLKQRACWAVTGNSFRNQGVVKLADNTGSVARRCVAGPRIAIYLDLRFDLVVVTDGQTATATAHVHGRLKAALHPKRTALHWLDHGALAVAPPKRKPLPETGETDGACFWIDPEPRPAADGGVRLGLFPVDGPGEVKASWGTADRGVTALVDNQVYRWRAATALPLPRMRTQVDAPLYAGGPPEATAPRRVSIDAPSALPNLLHPHPSDAEVSLLCGREAGASTRVGPVPTPPGIITHSLPEVGRDVEVLRVKSDGPLQLRSLTFDLLPRRL